MDIKTTDSLIKCDYHLLVLVGLTASQQSSRLAGRQSDVTYYTYIDVIM